METFRRFWSFLRRTFASTQAEQDLHDDIQGFADLAADELIAAGTAPEEARRQSLASMGGVESVKESVRAVRAGAWLEQAWRDFLIGLRGLGRSPGFALTAILTIGLGVGANATMFSVIDSALLKPVPYTRPGELLDLGHHVRHPNGLETTFVGLGWPEIQRWRVERDLFQGVEAYRSSTSRQWLEPDEAIRVGAFTPGLPELLGIKPRIGRVFTVAEAEGDADVIVIGEPLWAKAFGRRREVLGSTMTIDNRPVTIVGVMPATFRYGPGGGGATVAWTPLAERAGSGPGASGASPVFRLRSGLTATTAVPLAETIARRIQQEQPGDEPWTPDLIPLERSRVRAAGTSSPLWFLMAASGLVLLVACANVANLLLTRGAGRQEELAMRVALGASRGRIVRLLLAEGVAVALLGGMTAVALAVWSLDGVTAVVPPRMTSGLFTVSAPEIDWRVLLFALAVTAAVALLSSVLPAMSASRIALRHRAGSGVHLVGVTRTRRRTSRMLEAFQVALALVVAITCGLLTTSFVQLLGTDLGFDARGLGVVTFSFPAGKYKSDDAQRAAVANLLERVRATPGVRMAAIGNSPGATGSGRFVLSGETRSSGNSAIRSVGDHYFETTGVRIVAGRPIGSDDVTLRSAVAVIDETDARRIFGSDSPLGRRFSYSPYVPELTIVGVASHVATTDFAQPGSRVGLYLAESRPSLVFRTDGDLDVVLKDVRSALALAEPGIRITASGAATDVYDTMETYTVPRFYVVLVSMFGLLALATAGVGLYGLLAHAVGQRRREIGVRVALGATPGEIRALVLREALAPLVLGAAIGALGAWWTGDLVASLLYDVAPRDARAFAFGLAALLVTAILASLIPVRRATGVDPIVALRSE